MIPARFDYDVAESVEHAVELLAAGGGDTKLLAGGQSLIPALRLRIAQPAKLADLGRLTSLAYLKDGGTHIAIGWRKSPLRWDCLWAPWEKRPATSRS